MMLIPVFSEIAPDFDKQLIRYLRRLQRTWSEQWHRKQINVHDVLVLWAKQNNELEQWWSPISHQYAIFSYETWHLPYQQSMKKLSRFYSKRLQDKRFYDLLTQMSQESYPYPYYIQQLIQQFESHGIHLSLEKKRTYRQLKTQLTVLSAQFQKNVIDATQQQKWCTENKEALIGLPLDLVQSMIRQDTADHLYYELLLNDPNYSVVMTEAAYRPLRQWMYEQFHQRASQKPHHNGPIMVRLLKARAQLAHQLGYANYVAYQLNHRMVSDATVLSDFLNRLITQIRPHAIKEMALLTQWASETENHHQIEPWDVAYLKEQYRKKNRIDRNKLRHYFPLSQVIQGLFQLLNQLFDVTIRIVDAPVWHNDVVVWEICSAQEKIVCGRIYADFFARDRKCSGAWMDSYCHRYRTESNHIQLPIAYLTCNFMPPSPGEEALLTHQEIQTLFHEMGHCLHHVLTQVDELGISGISGVPWDGVEVPSQLLEIWSWDLNTLKGCARYTSDQVDQMEKDFSELIKTRYLWVGLDLMRQLSLALFDVRVHELTQITEQTIQDCWWSIQEMMGIAPLWPENKFPHSFKHIFSGGYAVGYYGYLWSEQLACDCYSLFQSKQTSYDVLGKRLKEDIYAVGGSRPFLDSIQAFLQRAPSPHAFLNFYGINTGIVFN